METRLLILDKNPVSMVTTKVFEGSGLRDSEGTGIQSLSHTSLSSSLMKMRANTNTHRHTPYLLWICVKISLTHSCFDLMAQTKFHNFRTNVYIIAQSHKVNISTVTYTEHTMVITCIHIHIDIHKQHRACAFLFTLVLSILALQFFEEHVDFLY